MALVLMVLAVPLARLRPRQGRFARVGYAVLAYFFYSNLLAAVRVWIQKDSNRRPARSLVGPPRAARVCCLAALERTPSPQAVAPALKRVLVLPALRRQAEAVPQ